MLFHRRHRDRIQRGILALACCALVAPPAASADKIGDSPADFGKPVTPAARIGDTPTDLPTAYGGPTVAAGFAQPLAPAAKGGDTPADFPGASRAPQYEAPRTISIVRPERTVVRDVDEVLPIVLSSAALLLALGGVGIALARTGVARRGLAGRTH
jgi:hypothetical protein